MKIRSFFLLGVITLILASCSSYKQVPYLQDVDIVNTAEALPLYDAKIMPKDLLTITVNTTDPEAAAPFNLTVQSSINAARTTTLTQQPTLQQYLVNNEGNIDFPVLGTLHIGGLTKSEAEDLIREKLKPYLRGAEVAPN